MSTIQKAGFDAEGFAGTWDRINRYVPRVGETFTVAEWRRYKHPSANGGRPDGSWKGEPFRCIEVRRSFDCSCCGQVSVVGQRLPKYHFEIGSSFLSRIEFNTDIIRLEPMVAPFPEHFPPLHPRFSRCSLLPCCRLENSLHLAANASLAAANAEQQREIERLRSQLGHANARIERQQTHIRAMEVRTLNALRVLEGR
jgi:hypothetical protein